MFEKTIYVQGAYEVLLRKVEQLETKLKSTGLRVPGSSRLGNYRRILDRVLKDGDSATGLICDLCTKPSLSVTLRMAPDRLLSPHPNRPVM